MQPGARRSCGRCAKAEDHSASPLEDVFARPSTRGLGWAGDNLLICESEGWVPERSAQGKTRGTNGGRIRAESLQPRREMTKAQRWIGEDSRVLRSRSRGQRWEELAKLINSLGTAESAGATTLHHSHLRPCFLLLRDLTPRLLPATTFRGLFRFHSRRHFNLQNGLASLVLRQRQ